MSTFKLTHDRLRRSSLEVAALTGFLALLTGGGFLLLLTGTGELTAARELLEASYRPERPELLAGEPASAGLVASVLFIVGAGVPFGMFPLNLGWLTEFEREPDGSGRSSGAGRHPALLGAAAIIQRLHGLILLLKLPIGTLAGYEFPVMLVLLVLGAATLLFSVAGFCRAAALRTQTAHLWFALGGFVLITLAVGPARNIGAGTGSSDAALVWFGGLMSALVLITLLAAGAELRCDGRSVDDPEDLTGLSRQRPFAAVALGIALLTACVCPPLPGFWWLCLIAVRALRPVAGSAASSLPVPELLPVLGLSVLAVSTILLTARTATLLSVLFLHEPLRRFDRPAGRTARTLLLAGGAALLVAGLGVDSVLRLLRPAG